MKTTEEIRLEEAREQKAPWKKWGPYLSERQWGTVREDYSDNGNAWDYFSHDQARSRAYCELVAACNVEMLRRRRTATRYCGTAALTYRVG